MPRSHVLAVLAAVLFSSHPLSAQGVPKGTTGPSAVRLASLHDPQLSPGPIKWLFSLSVATPVRVDVIDASGRRVRRLSEGLFAPGRHEVVWDGLDDDGNDLAPGVYLARTIRTRGTETTRILRLGR